MTAITQLVTFEKQSYAHAACMEILHMVDRSEGRREHRKQWTLIVDRLLFIDIMRGRAAVAGVRTWNLNG